MQFTCNIIEGKYLHITYYACIAYTIDLVIEDIGKLKWVDIIAKEFLKISKLIFIKFKSYLEVNFQEKTFVTIETRWYSFWNKFHNVGKNAKGENSNSKKWK